MASRDEGKHLPECIEESLDGRGAQELASRLMFVELVQRQDRRLCAYRVSKGRTDDGVEPMDQVSGEVFGRTQQKFEERRRPEVCLQSEEVGRKPPR